MGNKRLLKTALGLLLAFAMTVAPVFSAYAVFAAGPESTEPEMAVTQEDTVAEEISETDAASDVSAGDIVETSDASDVQPPEESSDQDIPEAVTVPEETAQPEEPEEIEEPEDADSRTEYVWKDKTVKVTATLSDAGAVPDDAELAVTLIDKTSDDYNYEAYMDALNKDSSSSYTEKNTILYDIAFILNGEEIEPSSGKVSVAFEFLDSQLSESIGAEKAADVNVIHLPLKDEVKDRYDTTADARKIDADDIKVETITADDNDLKVSVKNEKVVFETDSFSVFAYTVDFEYEDPQTGKIYTYNLEGEGSITIRELAVILGITTEGKSKDFAGNIDNVEFSDKTLVKVEKTILKGWVLKSLAPFSSEETLTITMKDGTVIEIRVTDTQESTYLTNFLTNAVITGVTQNASGQYVVEQGKDYSIILTFAESPEYQFDNDAVLTYQMPDGIKVITEQNGPMTINIVYKGRTYQVDATYHLSTDGRLDIDFDESDPDFPRLEESTNVSFRFTYHAQFDGEENKIHFTDDVERDVIFDEPEPGQAYASKTAVYDETTGTFHYTITVRATGDVTNVNVKDTITGDAIRFNSRPRDALKISVDSSRYTVNDKNDHGFDITFAEMTAGEVISIEYDATVDFAKDGDNDGKITVDQTKNTVTVKPEDGDPHNSEYSREITFKSTNKGNGTEAGTTEDGDKIINWVIEYNPLALVAVGGDKITDRISDDSTDYMKYYGDGILVEAYDSSGNLQLSTSYNYNNLTSYSDQSWTYTIPESHTTPWRYLIKYQTVVDMEKVNGSGTAITLSNTGNNDPGTIHVTPENQIDVVKDVESFNTEEITWNSSLSIPQGGLTKAVVTDTLPHIWLDGNHYDVLKEGSLEITGLLPGETYDVTYSTGSVVITFYKDQAKAEPGLQAHSGGRTVNVKLTTKVDQDWLQKGYETGGYEQNHTNTIDLNGKQDTATVTFGEPGIEKTGSTSDGVSFKYTLTIAGIDKEPLSITDKFDTNLLEVDTSKASEWDHMMIWGGSQYSQDSGKTPVSYTDAENGINLNVNILPKQADGNYYPYYKIIYYLKLKDGVDLEELAIANGGEYDLTNEAIWGDHNTTYTYKTKYDSLNKELLNSGQIGGTDRTAEYRITFNSAKATLNNGEPMEMTDVLSDNLSIDYSSIRITTDPAGVAVPYSISGGKDESGVPDGTTVATYTVPDSTKVVITYNAEVRGNGSQKIVNKVSVNGDDETVINTKDYGSASEGEGAIASFKIVKVDGYDANKKLSGVKFKIFAEDPNIDFGTNAGHAKEITLTTDDNGEIFFDGAAYDFYFDKVYHVQEVEGLENYGKIGFDYLVTLTNDMSKVDYGHYIYYYSDSMQIKNWPLEGLVVEKQVDSDVAADKDRYYTFKMSILNDDGSVNTDYNEKNGDDQFQNGVVEFQIKDKEQKMFWGFMKGTKYKVEEIDAEGFATTVTYSIFDEDGKVTEIKTDPGTSHSGELTQEDEVIIFKNSKHNESGKLTVTKKLLYNSEAETTKAGTKFKVGVFSDASGRTQVGAAKEIEVNAQGTGSVTFENLPVGTYYVFELDDENKPVKDSLTTGGITYAVTGSGDEAEITSNGQEVKREIKNNQTDKGQIEVTKQVKFGTDLNPSAKDKTFNVGLFSDAEGKTQVGNTKTVTIGADGTGKAEFTELDFGTYYVFELDGDGKAITNGSFGKYTVSGSGTSCTLSRTAKTAEVELVNTEDKTEISAEKKWKNADGTTTPPESGSIVFTLYRQIGEGAAEATDKTITLDGTVDENGEKEAWKATFENLPAKTDDGAAITYSVKETGKYTGYEVEGSDTVFVNGGAIVNKQETTSISALKKWQNADGTTTAPEGAKVVLQLRQKIGSGAATDVIGKTITLDGAVDENGEKEPWKATFENLPKYSGEELITYTIKETSGYAHYVISGEAEVEDKGVITNAQEKGKLTVTKKLLYNSEAETTKAGTKFKVGVFSDASGRTQVGAAKEIEVNAQGTGSVTFENLPVGTYYVFELDDDNKPVKDSLTTGGITYAVTGSGESAVISSNDQEIKKEITNNQTEKGQISVTKKVKFGTDLNPSAKDKTFNVGLFSDAAGTKQVGTAKTVTIGADGSGSTTFTELTFGTYYVFELDGDGKAIAEGGSLGKYTVSGSGTSCTLSRTAKTAEVELVNTEDKTEVSAEKAWLNADGTTTAPQGASVVLQLRQKVGSGEAEDVTGKTITLDGTVDANGEKEAWKATFENLPAKTETGAAITYSIKEVTGFAGYTIKGDAEVADKGVITNEEDTGSLKITKTVKFNGQALTDADKTLVDGEYSFTITGPKDYSNTVKLTIKDGKAETTQIDGLVPGDYVITENLSKSQIDNGIRILGDGSKTVKVEANNIESIPTAAFTNNTAKTQIEFGGTKVLNNGDISKYSFDFSLYKKTDYDNYKTLIVTEPATPKPTAVSTATVPVGSTPIEGKVSFMFSPIEYTLADLAGQNEKTFEYVAVENVPDTAVKVTIKGKEYYYDKEQDILYDPYEKSVIVKVTYDATTGTMSAVTEPATINLDFVNSKEYTKLRLTKTIDKFIGEDTNGEYVNATLVFRLTYDDPITGEKGKTREVSVQFDKNSVTAKTVEVDKVPIETAVEVKEIYSSNYRPGETVQATKATDDDGYPIWKASIDNTQLDKTTGSGIINKLKGDGNGKYTIDARQAKPAADPAPAQPR